MSFHLELACNVKTENNEFDKQLYSNSNVKKGICKKCLWLYFLCLHFITYRYCHSQGRFHFYRWLHHTTQHNTCTHTHTHTHTHTQMHTISRSVTHTHTLLTEDYNTHKHTQTLQVNTLFQGCKWIYRSLWITN